MTTESLKTILSLCKEMDVFACKLYTKMAHVTDNIANKSFWEEMASEERNHVIFWNNTINFSKENTIPNIFPEDSIVISELNTSINKAAKLLESIELNNKVSDFFLTAYWMEFLLLYPSLSTIFHYMSVLSDKDNPENDYEIHILKFVDGFKNFAKDTPEMELLGSLLSSLWKRNQQLSLMNIYDSLTGVFNRKGINDFMLSYGSLAQRNGYRIGVLMIDIDDFKKVNDTHGHQAGDLILKNTAQLLKLSIRASDLIGRFGGEEFLVFISNTDEKSIVNLATKLNNVIAQNNINSLSVTISIGCAIGNIDSSDISIFLEKLVLIADSKLYEAKHNGKNRFEI